MRGKYYGYKHSLRQYAAILYRTYPPGFAIFLRGEQVEPRNILKDLKNMRTEAYTPQGPVSYTHLTLPTIPLV